jgi:hypothetical protein
MQRAVLAPMRHGLPRATVASCLVMAGCLDAQGPPIPFGGCNLKFFPGECVDSLHPFRFVDDHDRAIATGSATRIRYLALDDLHFDLRSSDPSVLRIEQDGVGGFLQRGLADGIVTLEAHDPQNRLLDQTAVHVSRIETVQFAFGPAAEPALEQLAALPGATELIRVLPKGPGDIVLAGAEARITFAFTGGVAAGDRSRAESRIGRFVFFDWTRPPGFVTPVRFDTLGSATMTASVDGVVRGSLPIEVIEVPDQVGLVLAAPTMVTQWVQVAGLAGTDSRGVPVAGLIGDFTATPTELAEIPDPHGGEALISTLAPGVVTVTATLPGRTLTAQFTIEARP